MPVFNAGMFVSEAIDSIRNQTYTSWELIIINDGSTDCTPDIINSKAKTDSRIRIFNQQNKGISESLNFGISKSKGKWIARMDADDISHPERLEKQFYYLNNNPNTDILATQVSVFPQESAGEGIRVFADWTNTQTNHHSISASRFVDTPIIHPTVMMKADLFDRFGHYTNDCVPEDYQLWLRLLDQHVRFSKLNEQLLQWRDHKEKLTRTHPRYSEQAISKLKATYFERWFFDTIDPQRPLLAWGSGRKSRSRLKHLKRIPSEKPIDAYIDIDPRKINKRISGIPVIHPEEIKKYPTPFILGIVGSRGAREKISTYLENELGFTSEQDYMMFA